MATLPPVSRADERPTTAPSLAPQPGPVAASNVWPEPISQRELRVDEQAAIDTLATTISDLFAAGLDLCAARTMTNGAATERIDRAVAAIDDVIADLRARWFENVTLDLTEHQTAERTPSIAATRSGGDPGRSDGN